jgi:glucose/arabinose dehydrogenase
MLSVIFLFMFGSCATNSNVTSTARLTEQTTVQSSASGETTISPSVTSTSSSNPTTSASSTTISQTTGPLTWRIVDAYPNLSFDQPLYFAVAKDGSHTAFIVERTGLIRIIADQPDVKDTQIFLDLRNLIDLNGQEKGLLGLAFHPDYLNNGFFYVNYTNRDSTIISRYLRSAGNPGSADPASGEVFLTFSQPYANHNGGQLNFGPDGFLYIAVGDGGSSGDPQNNAQNLSTLLGKILCIDIDHPGKDQLYSIPATNPFAGNTQGFREEIYAFGLRNPWRFSFDVNGTLWAADVGQNKMEEIDLIINGGNYGWSVMEGTLAYKSLPGIDQSGMISPIWEYDHSQGISITGGYVYAGDQIPALKGRYVYGDYGSGRIWSLWIDGNRQVHNELLLDTDLKISSFGIDALGELRIVDLRGKIYLLQAD